MIDVDDWSPAPIEITETIDGGPSAALAGVLNTEPPGPELPPLWHWLHFLDRPSQSELGSDGHPLQGHFLPPIPNRRRMFAGGRLTLRTPLRIGDTITRQSVLASTTLKQGRTGEMLFVTVRHVFLNGDGVELGTEEQDLVYRSGGPATRPPRPSFEPPQVSAPWMLPVTTDPVLLFRFSALTYNAHRIHYDEKYATQAEGHPGLVVHGPLLAILCLELPRRAGHKVTGLSFRARSPVYEGQSVVATGSPDGELAINAPADTTAMTATFRCGCGR